MSTVFAAVPTFDLFPARVTTEILTLEFPEGSGSFVNFLHVVEPSGLVLADFEIPAGATNAMLLHATFPGAEFLGFTLAEISRKIGDVISGNVDNIAILRVTTNSNGIVAVFATGPLGAALSQVQLATVREGTFWGRALAALVGLALFILVIEPDIRIFLQARRTEAQTGLLRTQNEGESQIVNYGATHNVPPTEVSRMLESYRARIDAYRKEERQTDFLSQLTTLIPVAIGGFIILELVRKR